MYILLTMDKHTLRVLEFDKILNMTASYAATVLGKEILASVSPIGNIDEIKRRISIVSEIRRMRSDGRSSGIEHIEDLSALFGRVRPSDAVLEPFELRSFIPLFYSVLNLKDLISDPICPGLGLMVSALVGHPEIKSSIDLSIDRDGYVRDEASPELLLIRRNIKSYEKKIRDVLDGILNNSDIVPYLQDSYITERNNRWVIPVKRDLKSNVPGVVHDISNTGETVFVEPYSVQSIGNELETLRAEEKLEVFRILSRLSALLRDNLSAIESDYRIVAEVDSLQAIAFFSDKMDMSPPEINEKGYMRIVRGRHPLLWRALKKENRDSDLVPLDLEIGRDHSCIVITGSNAGGKTVALKTIGVLNLMALSGMHIPAGSGTSLPFLEKLYADIGDDQSIEQNLSTFSAHITRISEIIRQSSSRTLVIIDELGTGTDPEQGGALSSAILRKLNKSNALSVISTHLGTLKVFAHSEPGLINSAMEMEEVVTSGVRSCRPTYNLIVGEPGTSNAFEIAESLGLGEDIIRDARQLMSGEGMSIESLISDLKERTMESAKRLQETEELKSEAVALRLTMEKEIAELKSSKRDALSLAYKEAAEVVRRTKAEAGEIIKAIKKASVKEAGAAFKKLDEKHTKLKEAHKSYSSEELQPLGNYAEGQSVFVKTLGMNGIIISINSKAGKCIVSVQGKEVAVAMTALYEPVKESDEQKKSRRKESKRRDYAVEYLSVDAYIPDEINIVGQRVDPAISRIERYLNDALLAGLKKIRIIHGIGEGVLSSAIREYVKDHPLVVSSRRGEEDEGGEAVTVVYF